VTACDYPCAWLTGPFGLQVRITPDATSQPEAACPGSASFGVCVCLSIWPWSGFMSFRPLKAQTELALSGAAVSLHQSGVPARELAERAGHVRPSMSLDVYSHVMPSDEVTSERFLSLFNDVGGLERPSIRVRIAPGR
jgi:hypothetical protein